MPAQTLPRHTCTKSLETLRGLRQDTTKTLPRHHLLTRDAWPIHHQDNIWQCQAVVTPSKGVPDADVVQAVFYDSIGPPKNTQVLNLLAAQKFFRWIVSQDLAKRLFLRPWDSLGPEKLEIEYEITYHRATRAEILYKDLVQRSLRRDPERLCKETFNEGPSTETLCGRVLVCPCSDVLRVFG